VSAAVDKAQDRLGDVADKTQEKAGEIADQARQQATSRLAGGKDRAVDSLVSVAEAIRKTGQELRQQEQAPIAGVADGAAQQVERLAGYLREREVGQIIDETEGLARRRSSLFLGGAFTLGLLAARLLGSSAERARASRGQDDAAMKPASLGTMGSAAARPSGIPDRPLPAVDRPSAGSVRPPSPAPALPTGGSPPPHGNTPSPAPAPATGSPPAPRGDTPGSNPRPQGV
jgi:hypothetical protein